MKLSKESIRSIIIFRALALGDMLCAIPAVRALRRAYPEAAITLASLPWAERLCELFPQYFDDFIPFYGVPGMPESEESGTRLPDFFRACRQRRFDLALQMHGSGELTNPLVENMEARHTSGFYRREEDCHDPFLFKPYPDEGHEIERLLSLIEFLGIPDTDTGLEFPVFEESPFLNIPEAGRLAHESFICLHPGARLLSRRWPAQRFAAVADLFAAEGYQIIWTGTADERRITEAAAGHMKFPSLNLAGKTSLESLGGLLISAGLLICNDTGISHIAAALGVPSIVLVMGSDPGRWAPLNTAKHTAVYHPVECRPCYDSLCPVGHLCASMISVEEVFNAGRQRLNLGEKHETSQHSDLARTR